MVVPDIDDPFLPSSDSLLLDLGSMAPQIEALLKKFPQLFPVKAAYEDMNGMALHAAFITAFSLLVKY